LICSENAAKEQAGSDPEAIRGRGHSLTLCNDSQVLSYPSVWLRTKKPQSSEGVNSSMLTIKAILADITHLEVDVIVNAADESLLGGGGVDGAIHQAAGHELLAECQMLGGCKPGEVALTEGYQLPAKKVIHTVGPRWRDGHSGESECLRSCYGRSIARAESLKARSIAFPGISTGVFRFPKPLATRIAVEAVLGSISEPTSLEEIIFCCFSEADLQLYLEALNEAL